MKRFVTTSALALWAASGAFAFDVSEKANEIAKNTIIIDTHIDVPFRLNDGWIDVTEATEGGDFDYPRAVKGGLNAPFMSIYTPAALDGTPNAKAHAERMIEIVEKIVETAPKKFQIAHSVADVEASFSKGIIALPLGMENGSPISGDLDNIDYFYKRGIRYVTLSHSRANGISDSSYDDNKKWSGLSDFGIKAVERMNNLGIMVDVSHISDRAFWKVMEVANAPAIASHSSARKFTPGFERNMNDKMIKALAEQGGVIMINYGSSFLTKDANQYNLNGIKAYQAYIKAEGLENTQEQQDKFRKIYAKETPYPFATLDDVLNHIDHVVQITGSVDYVGIGSDYDGVGNTLPVGLKDVASYPTLIDGLLKRGYSETDIKKILSGNILRVWRAVEQYAAKQ
jgi:membrane dipeptidase